MKIIIIDDSSLFMEHIVEQLQKIKKGDDKIIALCCDGGFFTENFFDTNKNNIKEVDWNFVDSKTKLEETLSLICKKHDDYVIASDLTMFYDHGPKYENYVPIQVINKMIKENNVEASRITIYSQSADFQKIREIFENSIKTYIRPGVFTDNETQNFYDFITS